LAAHYARQVVQTLQTISSDRCLQRIKMPEWP
jgi:hypothetical protein